MHFKRTHRLGMIILSGGLLLGTLSACSNSDSSTTAEVAPAAKVTVLTVQPQSIQIEDNLPARVQAFRTAQIRPQVGGIIEKRLFKQGSEVTAGQSLFQINSDIFRADVNSAQAALEKAQSEVYRLKTQLSRLESLVKINAISKQSYDDTVAQLKQAQADVAQTKATLMRQSLNLQYAVVRAPISGRIGSEMITEGALVSAADVNPMAIVQQIDKVYVDVKQPQADLEALRNSLNAGDIQPASQQDNKTSVQILDSKGKPYPVTGRILFSDLNVDPSTGDSTLRIEVDNPQRHLLPGMYVRANIIRGSISNALLVPEQAVVRDEQGNAQLIVINAQKSGVARKVQLGKNYNNQFVVSQGLKAGETIVVEGQERILPGAPLHMSPWKNPHQATPQNSLPQKSVAKETLAKEATASQTSETVGAS